MKKFLAALFVATTFAAANARTFEIKVLNTPTINIGGRTLKAGDKFEDSAPVNWASDRQAMKVLSDDNKVYVLSKDLMAKRNAKTFADYLASVKTASSRNDGDNFPVTVADHRRIFEGDFVLLDTIALKVGWRTDDSSYFEAQTMDLGENNFSFVIPANDNVLVITKETFAKLPSECNYVILKIDYIEKEYGDTTEITDSMAVEIVPEAAAD